ncbi:tubulin-specific chaperone E [Alosa alosa]|uniref:tubulin-specific chaperone E n=1 Tax=Alosa sapidissima TaxID=34773 RepID=UPI001C083DED|nr:tubulin-specific chaperone E [Alosa sapidissima]XP_041959193.1 tubulin-specific chaperone E [Alosa sapidissima]XP_041959194.1 tubulin-specific chaperone E [Alosa sapidissima]XP_048105328.1 tubulin-specific chaperone E [Alosa alosa]
MRVKDGEQPAMEEGVPSDAVGRRISCDGERATVRFVGTVPPTKGVWLGVEWDNPERGKHDGSHEGVHYFTCRHPTGGSFVRPKKASFGVDFLTALRQRYEKEREGMEFTISTCTLEMVGFQELSEKQRVENLKEVALRSFEVWGTASRNEIQKTAPDVEFLDLSQNLLSSWEALAAITEQMEKLRALQMGYNRLTLPSDPSSLTHAFTNLRVLALPDCGLTWPEVLQCACMWPSVEELYLRENNITDLQRPVDVLQSLTHLDLSRNPITSETLTEIGKLPQLDTLNLSETGLTSIEFNDVPPGSKTAMFPALQKLTLMDNKIAEWWVVNELEKLRSLVQLMLQRNPLMERERNPQTACQLAIARVGQLTKLNNTSEILPAERRGAELDYIKMFGRQWLESGGHQDPEKNNPNAEFTTQHPRYMTLIQKHGAPDESELRVEKPFALKNQLLTLTFICPDDADRKPIQKKLPCSMVVQKVKGLLHRLLKLPGADLRLSYTCSRIEGTEIEIENDMKTLQFYSVEDGDSVLVRWS